MEGYHTENKDELLNKLKNYNFIFEQKVNKASLGIEIEALINQLENYLEALEICKKSQNKRKNKCS